MKTAVIAVTESAESAAQRLVADLPDCSLCFSRERGWLKANIGSLFRDYDGLVFITAAGIAVRMIAPHINSKYTDPAVVVVDDALRYAVSLLSGHEGGANALAARVSTIIGAEAVITTASDTNRRYIVGVGCRRGVSEAEVEAAVSGSLVSAGLSWDDVRLGSTIDLKRDEAGLTGCFTAHGLPVKYFSKEQINCFDGDFSESETAMRNIGVKAVAEPCALLAGRKTSLIVRKRIMNNTTVAIAKEDSL